MSSPSVPMASSPAKVWFPYWRPQPEARLRLFCFPFAGGTASAFHRWARPGLEDVDVLAAQYPGRESRLQEPAYRRVPELVQALGPIVRPLLDRPFAFLGYSLGAYVSLELAHWLRREGAPAPLGLMLAAARPPHQRQSQKLYTLRDEDFLAELQRYGGTPAEVLKNRELMELLLPVLRADFEMSDEYRRAAEPRLTVPFSIWGGEQDTTPSPEDLVGWRDHTTASCALEVIPGGHFFLLSSGDQLRASVHRTLHQWAAGQLPTRGS